MDRELQNIQRIPLFRDMDLVKFHEQSLRADRASYGRTVGGLWGRHFELGILGPGEALLNEGEKDLEFFIVLEGHVDILAFRGAAEHRIARRGPGEFFGEVAAMTFKPRTASVVGNSKTRFLTINPTSFLTIMDRSDIFRLIVGQAFNQRNAEAVFRQMENQRQL